MEKKPIWEQKLPERESLDGDSQILEEQWLLASGFHHNHYFHPKRGPFEDKEWGRGLMVEALRNFLTKKEIREAIPNNDGLVGFIMQVVSDLAEQKGIQRRIRERKEDPAAARSAILKKIYDYIKDYECPGKPDEMDEHLKNFTKLMERNETWTGPYMWPVNAEWAGRDQAQRDALDNIAAGRPAVFGEERKLALEQLGQPVRSAVSPEAVAASRQQEVRGK